MCRLIYRTELGIELPQLPFSVYPSFWEKITKEEAKPGDAALMGKLGPQHIVMVVDPEQELVLNTAQSRKFSGIDHISEVNKYKFLYYVRLKKDYDYDNLSYVL